MAGQDRWTARDHAGEPMTEHVAVDQRKRQPERRARPDFSGEIIGKGVPRGRLIVGYVVHGDSRRCIFRGKQERLRHVFDMNEAHRDTAGAGPRTGTAFEPCGEFAEKTAVCTVDFADAEQHHATVVNILGHLQEKAFHLELDMPVRDDWFPNGLLVGLTVDEPVNFRGTCQNPAPNSIAAAPGKHVVRNFQVAVSQLARGGACVTTRKMDDRIGYRPVVDWLSQIADQFAFRARPPRNSGHTPTSLTRTLHDGAADESAGTGNQQVHGVTSSCSGESSSP